MQNMVMIGLNIFMCVLTDTMKFGRLELNKVAGNHIGMLSIIIHVTDFFNQESTWKKVKKLEKKKLKLSPLIIILFSTNYL